MDYEDEIYVHEVDNNYKHNKAEPVPKNTCADLIHKPPDPLLTDNNYTTYNRNTHRQGSMMDCVLQQSGKEKQRDIAIKEYKHHKLQRQLDEINMPKSDQRSSKKHQPC